MTPSVLVVEDEDALGALLQYNLDKEGYRVAVATDGEEALVLIDEARATDLYGRMGPGVEVSGGSCANTVAGASALGSRVAFIGKVARDELGDIFRHDLTSLGVHFDTPAAADGPPTARCPSRSSSITCRPARARSAAAVAPAGPPPTTTTSNTESVTGCHLGKRRP